jgi:hypothetical protein
MNGLGESDIVTDAQLKAATTLLDMQLGGSGPDSPQPEPGAVGDVPPPEWAAVSTPTQEDAWANSSQLAKDRIVSLRYAYEAALQQDPGSAAAIWQQLRDQLALIGITF